MDEVRYRGVRGWVRAVADATMGRWAAAETNRINSAHWGKADGASINASLEADGAKLYERAELETCRNTILEGVLETFITDMVGETGPQLQVSGPDAKYNTALEDIWRQVWEQIDYEGVASGADKVALWLYSWCKYGDAFEQFVMDFDGPRELPRVRLKSVHAKRVDTPVHKAGLSLMSSLISRGVERDMSGRIVAYHVADDLDALLFNFDTVPARDMLHGFKVIEAGQLRGVPWLASALEDVAQLADFDKSVLIAARTAAEMAAVFQPKHEDIEPITLEANSSVKIKQGSIVAAPPGYELAQLKPEHPALNYVEYRRELKKGIGRGLEMPLLKIDADASNHNYSSARFDDGSYNKGLSKRKGFIARRMLNRVLMRVEAEARAMELIGARPVGTQYEWRWPKNPHVDPLKEALAKAKALEGGLTTYAATFAEEGMDYSATLERQAQEAAERKAKGLPVAWEQAGGLPGPERASDAVKQRVLDTVAAEVLVAAAFSGD